MKDVILHLPSWLLSETSRSPLPASARSTTATSTPNNTASPSSPTSIRRITKVRILFFITGNPGLIGYYDDFLALLAQAQEEKTVEKEGSSSTGEGRRCVIVAGASLGGFFAAQDTDEDEDSTFISTERRGQGQRQGRDVKKITQQLLLPDPLKTKDIYDLQDQINLSYLRLLSLVENLRKEFQRTIGNAAYEVILAGHSVGAYIALELVRLHYEASVSEVESRDCMFDILATFLLTPTIHNISQSSSGRIATPILDHLPFFPALVQLAASGLATTLPISWMQNIVRRVTGMENSSAVETTTDFLRLPGAVKQALYMAGCEMREIGEDKWTEEIWGAVDAAASANEMKLHNRWMTPKHFFLFAREDHWVANATREAIANKMRGRAVMLIDSEGLLGIQHAWCLHQSDTIAGIANRWIDELFDEVS